MRRLVAALFVLVIAFFFFGGRAHASQEPAHDEPQVASGGSHTMRVGVEVASISKFELGPGAYNVEFYLSVHCDREPCKADLDVTNGKITGRDKIVDLPLEKEVKVKAELTGFIDLSEYPFDSHVLHISLVDRSDPVGTRIELDKETTSIDSDVKLAGWHVEGWSADVQAHKLDDHNTIYELEYGVLVKRPRLSAFMKTLLPVFFMVFVAGFTLLLKPKSAAGRLTTCTAGLMSVVMFHLSATSALPPLGYLTRMDKLMIGTYVVYLVNILFSVAMVRFDEKKNEKYAELAYLISAGAVPGIALCVWVAVFMRLV